MLYLQYAQGKTITDQQQNTIQCKSPYCGSSPCAKVSNPARNTEICALRDLFRYPEPGLRTVKPDKIAALYQHLNAVQKSLMAGHDLQNTSETTHIKVGRTLRKSSPQPYQNRNVIGGKAGPGRSQSKVLGFRLRDVGSLLQCPGARKKMLAMIAEVDHCAQELNRDDQNPANPKKRQQNTTTVVGGGGISPNSLTTRINQ